MPIEPDIGIESLKLELPGNLMEECGNQNDHSLGPTRNKDPPFPLEAWAVWFNILKRGCLAQQ